MSILTQQQVDSIRRELGNKIDTDEYRTAFGKEFFGVLLRSSPQFIDSLGACRGMSYEAAMKHSAMDTYALEVGTEVMNMLEHAANEQELDRLIKACAEKMRHWGLKNFQIEYSPSVFVSILKRDLKSTENNKNIAAFLEYMSQEIAGYV